MRLLISKRQVIMLNTIFILHSDSRLSLTENGVMKNKDLGILWWAVSADCFTLRSDVNDYISYCSFSQPELCLHYRTCHMWRDGSLKKKSGRSFTVLWRQSGINHINVKQPSSSYEPKFTQWQIPFPLTQMAWMLNSAPNRKWSLKEVYTLLCTSAVMHNDQTF